MYPFLQVEGKKWNEKGRGGKDMEKLTWEKIKRKEGSTDLGGM